MTDKTTISKRRRILRGKVELLLPDSLMFVLAIMMAIVIGFQVFSHPSTSTKLFFKILDYAILAIFIMEYFLKAASAENRKLHILNPWHILDLFIILTPFLDFLPKSLFFRNSTPVLRLLRIIRLIAVGGRALDRKLPNKQFCPANIPENREIRIRIAENDISNGFHDVPIGDIPRYINNPLPTWIDITGVEKEDIAFISSALSLSEYFLSTELFEESYPHIGRFENHHLIYAQIPDSKGKQGNCPSPSVRGQGVLIICSGLNMITIASDHSDFCEMIVRQAHNKSIPGAPFLVSALYAILKNILDMQEQLIKNLEVKLLELESIPTRELSASFLDETFLLRKEVSHLVPSLVHMREILKDICSNQISLSDFHEQYKDYFRALIDRAGFLQETAITLREGIVSLRELHINTTSYEMNRVMRLIAVITCMAIIPTLVGGLLGMNLHGNPWPMELWHIVVFVVISMLGLGWIFYRLGWLKK